MAPAHYANRNFAKRPQRGANEDVSPMAASSEEAYRDRHATSHRAGNSPQMDGIAVKRVFGEWFVKRATPT